MALHSLLVNRQLGCNAPAIIESRTREGSRVGGHRAFFSTVDDNVVTLNWREIVGRLGVVLSNSPPGMSRLFFRLMSFEDGEIFIRNLDSLAGRTVSEAAEIIENAVIMGTFVSRFL